MVYNFMSKTLERVQEETVITPLPSYENPWYVDIGDLSSPDTQEDE